MKLKALVLIPALAVGLAGCTNEEMGALFGATAGALIGSQIGSGHEGTMAAIAGLSLAGAYIGSEIGQDMDEADRREMQRRTREALERSPSGATSTWNNPDTGSYGANTPSPGYVENVAGTAAPTPRPSALIMRPVRSAAPPAARATAPG